MSTHSYYQAIGEESPLFLRLRGDPLFHLLFAQLMIIGPGPFARPHLEADEIRDTLDWMAGEGLFASRAQADRALADVKNEIEHAVASDPEIGRRSAYLEQVHRELEADLLSELDRRGGAPGGELVGTLLWGGASVNSSASLAPDMPAFRLVPPSLVAEGAALLGPIEAVELYPKDRWDRCPAEEYDRWRWLYREASRVHAAILVLTA